MDITGFVKMVGQTQEVSSSFKKREIVVTTEEQYPQHILIEFTQDKCELLNNVRIGESVKIGINLRGREWTNPQGETRYFNSIQGWRIEQKQQQGYTNTGYHGQGSAVDAYNQQNGYQQAPQQGYGQPQQNFNPNPNYGGNQNFNQQQQGYGQQQNFNPNFQQAQGNQNNEEPDDLPF